MLGYKGAEQSDRFIHCLIRYKLSENNELQLSANKRVAVVYICVSFIREVVQWYISSVNNKGSLIKTKTSIWFFFTLVCNYRTHIINVFKR